MNASSPTTARRWPLLAVSVLLVAALGAAITGGVLWSRADSVPAGMANAERSANGSGADPTALDRQTFLLDAAQAAVDLTTVTPDDIDGMLDRVRRSSTSTLAAELDDPRVRDTLVQEVRDRGFAATPTVNAISTTSFDPASGRAQALVFITQEIAPTQGGDVILRRQGISLFMQLENGVWKASELSQLFQGEGSAPSGQQPQSVPSTTAPAPGGSDSGSPQSGSPESGSPESGSPAPSAENPAGS